MSRLACVQLVAAVGATATALIMREAGAKLGSAKQAKIAGFVMWLTAGTTAVVCIATSAYAAVQFDDAKKLVSLASFGFPTGAAC